MADLILNRYKAMEEAGKGGFGTVIVAWDTRMRRKVAIKKIALPQNATKEVDEAGEHWEDNIPGLKEARTAAMIQDANIVTVHDFEVEGEFAYIIMEYVEGLTLTQFLREYSDLMTLDMLTCIFNGVAHALEVAHAENVLHLDIKPDNVLIDSKGKVKVTDFGLATLADEFGYGTANAGTIGYMPPEQMRKQALDVRTDEWALACITYEMLCGQNPFDAKDLQTSLAKTQDAKLLLPSTCWEDLPSEIDDAMFMALSPKPEDRFDTVSEFREEMSDYLSNPRAGQKQLSAIFRDRDIDEIDEVEVSQKSRILEGLTNNTGQTILGRAYAAIATVPLALVSVLNIDFFGAATPNLAGIIAIVVIIGAAIAWPCIGLGLGALALALALMLSGNIIVGIVLVLASIGWGAYALKKSLNNSSASRNANDQQTFTTSHIALANTASAFPLFGSFGFAQAAPFLAGLFCDIKDALINTAYGFLLCLMLAGLGSHSLVGWELLNNINFLASTSASDVQDAIFLLLTRPATYI